LIIQSALIYFQYFLFSIYRTFEYLLVFWTVSPALQ